MDKEYVVRHEQFVSGHHGTTIWEIQLVTSVGPFAVLLRNLVVPWLFQTRDFATGSTINRLCKFVLDYTITIVPILFSITLFSERLSFLVAILLLCSIIVIIFSLCEHVSLYRERPPWNSLGGTVISPANQRRPAFVSYFRAHILIATILGILAVDFPIFPRRFAKAETFGYGLMDVGVGFFVIVNGMVVDTGIKCNRRSLLKNLNGTLPLLALGLVRLIALNMTGYQQHISEYGMHWNFFFTLASVKILGCLFTPCLKFRYASASLAVILALVYEYALQYLGLKNVILYGTGPADRRDNLFDANREGIVSICGYLALYFFGIQLGRFTMKPRRQLKEYGSLLIQLINMCFLSCILLLLADGYISPPSRRIVNMTYILWMVFLTFTQLTIFAAIETIVLIGAAAKLPIFSAGNEQNEPFRLLEPCLWKSINENALWSFLLANVMTGLVNLSFPTLDADHAQSLAILSTYSFFVFAVVFVRYVSVSKREERWKLE